MKKAVITILGIQNPTFDDEGVAHVKDYSHQASYYFDESDERPKKSYSTLPLLIEKFADEYDIVPIYTQSAKQFNQEVLDCAKLECDFDDKISLIQEEEYFEVFTRIDELIDSHDEVIVDLTHGFRHIPILTIIDLVIQNFNSTKKIQKILFAKEIVKHTPKDTGEYEIVDLKEYLDIANISFVLSSFEKNYTIANHIKVLDKDYQALIDMLSRFTEHIMANSLLTLFKDQNSLVENMYKAIEHIKKNQKSKPILSKLDKIQEHLKLFVELKDKTTYIQLFELAKIVNQKGYFLNAITLLDEAIGWYCADCICDYSDDFKKKYDNSISYDSYGITSNAKNIVKLTLSNKNYNNEYYNFRDLNYIRSYIKSIEGGKKFASNLLIKTSNFRNNLAHANSRDKLNEIKKELETLFARFYTYCIKQNILKKNDASIGDLTNKFNT